MRPIPREEPPDDAPEDVAPGSVVAGRYKIESLVFRGGMSSVWAAYDKRVGRRVAVKVIAFTEDDLGNMRARFKREVALSAHLRGRTFVEVYDHGLENNRAFMVMELLEGETLLARMKRMRRLPAADVLSLARGVAAGLRVAHALQVVHRDLKPGNIFFAKPVAKSSGVQPIGGSDAESIKILDFGIAKDAWDSTRLTRPDLMLGSVFYMSPEQVISGRDVDTRSDLWSLAVVLYLALTGRLPFRGPPSAALVAIVQERAPAPSTIIPLSPAVDHFFERAFAKDATKRFANVDDFVEALSVALSFASDDPLVPCELEDDARRSFEELDEAGTTIVVPTPTEIDVEVELEADAAVDVHVDVEIVDENVRATVKAPIAYPARHRIGEAPRAPRPAAKTRPRSAPAPAARPKPIVVTRARRRSRALPLLAILLVASLALVWLRQDEFLVWASRLWAAARSCFS